MTARWIAGGVVVLGCGYLGIWLASRLETRVRQLEALESMLVQLGFNIGFLGLPVAEAMRRTAAGQTGAVRELLNQVTRQLAGCPQCTLGEAWIQAVRDQGRSLCLKAPEMEALEAFAAHLGQGDRRSALDNIQMTAAKLKLLRESAEAVQAKDGRLCRSMGFLAGILLALLLF